MHGVVFELLHTRTEPLVGIIVIVGYARTEDVQKREARMLNTLLDQLSKMLLLSAVAAGDERGACGESQRNRVDRRFDVAERHALRLHPDAAGRRSLARGQA